MKARYLAKHGANIKNMDKCMACLSNLELQAFINSCRTLDATYLDIPVYAVHLPSDDADDPEVALAHEGSDPLKARSTSKAPASEAKCSQKMAGLTKRGMAQPRKR